MTKRVVLVGAGHVHMAALAEHARFRAEGIELTLVDPGQFWFGSRTAALLAGHIGVPALRCSLRPICRACDITLRIDRAIGLEPRHRRLWLAGGDVLGYDAVSLNVGCEMDTADFEDPSARVQVWDASSVQQLAQLYEALDTNNRFGRAPRVAIAGADPAAVEIAAGLSSPAAIRPSRIALYVPTMRLVPNAPDSIGRRLARVLVSRNVDLVTDTTIAGLADGAIVSVDGRHFATDHLVVAHRRRSIRFIHATRLPAELCGLHVGKRLYSPADARVFASGGCARPVPDGRMPVSDIARQARVLAHNLRAGLTGRPYRDYRARGRLQFIDLADGSALAWCGRWSWRSASIMQLKARRDARYRARLEALVTRRR